MQQLSKMSSMQRLEGQITQTEVEIKEVKEKVEKENDPALKLEAEKQLTALRQELTALRIHINKLEDQKLLLMQQQGESQLALLIKISLPCMAK